MAPRNVYLDCTRTFLTNVHTGIERMVSALVHEGPEIGNELGFECEPILFKTTTGFERLSHEAITNRFRPRDPNAAGRLTLQHRLRRQLDKTGLIEAVRTARSTLDSVAEASFSPIRRMLPSRIPFGPGDIIILLDVNVRSNYWPDLQRARDAGAKVCLCVLDLIPLSHPNVVDRGVVNDFSRWWKNASQTVDSFVCISEATWREVQSHLPSQFSHKQGSWFKLGVGLDKMHSTANVSPRISDAFAANADRPTYLQVGMMSPRKNHALAIDACEKLWDDPAGPALVIVGKYGWRCEDVARRIREHQEFGKRLFWFESVNDDELDACYRQSTALLTTSFAEGFNLPIVEALSRGTPVIATDIPTHREVGGRFAAYYPSDNADGLATILKNPGAAFQNQNVLPPSQFAWPDWNESTREFLEQVLSLSAVESSAQVRITSSIESRRAA